MAFRKAVGWSFLAQFLDHVLTVGFVVILARFLVPADFGIVAAAMVLQILAIELATWGIDKELLQRENATDSDFSTGFWLASIFSLGLALLVMALAPQIARVIGDSIVVPVLRLLSIVVVFQSVTAVLMARLIRSMEMARFTQIMLLSKSTAGIVAVTLATSGYGIYALVAQNLASAILCFAMALLWGRWRPDLSFDRQIAAEILRFGAPMSASNLLAAFNRESPKLLVGAFLGPTALGYFSMAMRVTNLLTSLLVLTYSRVSVPAFAQIRSDTKRLSSAYLYTVRLISTVLLPAFVLTAILSGTLVLTLFGPQWHTAGDVLAILAAAGILTGANYINGAILISLGRPGIRLGFAFIRALVGTALLLWMAPYGLLAMAAALVVRGLVVEPAQLLYVLRTIGLKLSEYFACQINALTGVLILATVGGVTQYLMAGKNSLLSLLVVGILSTLSYATWLYHREPWLREEIANQFPRSRARR
jgi:PST family polysaccharide transporter